MPCSDTFFFGATAPLWARASSFTRFLDHTQRRITVGRTPLDKWSARCRDLYLTTHNTQNRRTSMPPVGLEPTISADERPQTYALTARPLGPACSDTKVVKFQLCPIPVDVTLIPFYPRGTRFECLSGLFVLLWECSYRVLYTADVTVPLLSLTFTVPTTCLSDLFKAPGHFQILMNSWQMISYCSLLANIIGNSLLLFDQSVDMIQHRLTVKGTVMDWLKNRRWNNICCQFQIKVDDIHSEFRLAE
jgi:hypothetical protein